MAKPEWGTKRTCQNCGARFYDLRRETVVCPVCNTAYDPDRQPRSRRSGTAVRPEQPVVATVGEKPLASEPAEKESMDAEPAEEDEGDGVETAEDLEEIDEEDRDLIEDTSDLGEDDDDIGEVIEHIDDDTEDKA